MMSWALSNAGISESAKYPKLLTQHEYYIRLLIQYVHKWLIHAGVSHALASLHQEYWIVKEEQRLRKYCLIVWCDNNMENHHLVFIERHHGLERGQHNHCHSNLLELII